MRERTLDDLCTPRYVLDLVERVGEIGLDPCSNRWSIVPARVKLDIDEGRDGLSTAWKEILADGELVFCNPPYGRGQMPRWAEKIAAEAADGCEIIALVRGDWSTGWWHTLRESADAVCYWRGRVRFLGGAQGSGTFASALFYFGARPHLFAHVFAPVGDVRVIQ